jgi:endoglucanase
MSSVNRRDFLASSAAATAGLVLGTGTSHAQAPVPQPRIPRWRGFNFPDLMAPGMGRAYQRADFELVAEWGFDFVRLPLSYWVWSKPESWLEIDEASLAPVDQAVEWGKELGLHVNINFHRIPGYCVNGREREPEQLFDSPRESMQRALDAALLHWRTFATRYKGVPSERVSFDLFNEPPFMADQSRYVEVAKALIAAIREIDPRRLIVADGADIGQTPVMGLVDQGVVQSTRGYLPKMVSHYTATWVPKAEFESFATPTWPMTDDRGVVWNREKLRAALIDTWTPLVAAGVPVHVGEWGCHNRTPHAAMLGWMSDLLALWKEAGWGWSMWNLRGGFGVLDSGRKDVEYETFRGRLLDRRLLELLRAN